jgi:phosphomannomutase
MRRGLDCFKAYDVRGRLGETLDEDIACRIGSAFGHVLGASRVVVGHDARASSPALKAAAVRGLQAVGADVTDIGLCGTEEVYFATGHLGADGGLMVTASHNPIEWNGMKLVGPGSRPIDPGHELARIRAVAEAGDWRAAATPGRHDHEDTRDAFADRVAGFARGLAGRPFRIVADSGNGTAGAAFDAVVERLVASGAEIEAIRLRHAPDPTFPHGIPNPLLPGNRAMTAEAVMAHGADLGLAWDGDFDRCFFFDETGDFVDGQYIVALLARASLALDPGATIVLDPRVTWATTEAVMDAGGSPVLSKTGHAFVKARMRETGAVYGGEMSAHHYFREFFHCDSGMVPWVLMLSLLAESGRSLSDLVAEMRRRFPASGEINFRVGDTAEAIATVEARLAPEALSLDRLDGLTLEFPQWRLNLRGSNTEPLLRLNIESRADADLIERKVAEISGLVGGTRI